MKLQNKLGKYYVSLPVMTAILIDHKLKSDLDDLTEMQIPGDVTFWQGLEILAI